MQIVIWINYEDAEAIAFSKRNKSYVQKGIFCGYCLHSNACNIASYANYYVLVKEH